MGRAPQPNAAVYGPTLAMVQARGANVLDADGNRYVDFAAGFGALLLGHSPDSVLRAVSEQSQRLLQALGDVYPSDAKIALMERLVALYPKKARAIVCQSGSDAVSAALKTAALATGRPGLVAFNGSYHGLGYGPLAACGLRASYREPFSLQLNPNIHFVSYPGAEDDSDLDQVLGRVERALAGGEVGAVLVEPILGRGGVVVPPGEFLPELARSCRDHGALLIADEIWTGLGRSGKLLYSLQNGVVPDLVCLGKGLGGGLPVSAVIGSSAVMDHWRRDAEVVHTSTFAGAPLAAASALATLEHLTAERLPERAAVLGTRFKAALSERLSQAPVEASVRGEGLMLGIDFGATPGRGSRLQEQLLAAGFITSSGGGKREILVLTPPLNIAETLCEAFVDKLADILFATEVAPT
jgi:4-aminobutyrate aminotransferase/(S)-3-amino-2-methylpropionate transaminase